MVSAFLKRGFLTLPLLPRLNNTIHTGKVLKGLACSNHLISSSRKKVKLIIVPWHSGTLYGFVGELDRARPGDLWQDLQAHSSVKKQARDQDV